MSATRRALLGSGLAVGAFALVADCDDAQSSPDPDRSPTALGWPCPYRRLGPSTATTPADVDHAIAAVDEVV